MMRGQFFLIAAAAGLTACSQSGGDSPATNSTANATAAAPAKKRPTYCFFKDAATRGWSAAADAGGNVTVKGQAMLDDSRYRGDLSQSEISGDTATVWVTMVPNNTGFADEDDWWDVAVTVPDSTTAANVIVLCGKKEVARLKVRRG